MKSVVPKSMTDLIVATKVLIIDDEPYMRKVIRSLLLSSGLKNLHEAPNGSQGLDAVCSIMPDVVILDWEMPDMSGADFMRLVRNPIDFPLPGVPIIMLTGHVERDRVVEAVRLGVHEFLCKPVSAKSLLERIVTIRLKPRPIVRIGRYYGPKPRKMMSDPTLIADPEADNWLTGDVDQAMRHRGA
jgi:CheY-like chemotaxis protein